MAGMDTTIDTKANAIATVQHGNKNRKAAAQGKRHIAL